MWISIAAGGEHTCSLDRRGRAYCWGDGSAGTLGHGGFGPSLLPLPAASSGTLSGRTLGTIATGAAHTCALDIEGRAYCWGRGEEGQLGAGGAQTSKVAVPVAMPPGTRFATITVGASHTCAVTDTGQLYCWGGNGSGQLGTAGIPGSAVPVAVDLVPAGFVVSVAAGTRHTCAVTAEGAAICWGAGTHGQLGGGIVDRRGPTAVAADSRYVAIAAGADFTCATTTAAQVECWGAGQRGQLGDGMATDRVEPAPIRADAPLDLLTAGGSTACARQSPAGGVLCWGADDTWQGGDGDRVDALIPHPVPLPPGEVAALSTSGSHTCAVTADGLAHCWGAGNKGQLGIDLLWPSHRPVTVSEPIR